ncbi:30S ribosomal protein S20 [Candidatus Rhabdochlamydia sp. T3358]|uniref:30S ribosomal protein S20 n=1 Tax=Candidatus Rhabdochlamydia sp. T3358 TaxID=2099795 RepID=UPI0010B9D07E|nr:30S ribosomal protein S20 [Candidatus Rhabdochlamydia sp. T3358]VHN99567.1 30S ribosomal protein S20 [Candidatus Rhabdochlamydia sp. T3358]
MANEKKDKQVVKRPSAEKRNIQSKKRNLCNRALKARVGSASRSLKEALSQKDASSIQEKLNEVYSLMDKGVKKGVFKINKASRLKARLSTAAKKASV